MKKVIIIGAGGHGKVIADIIKLCGDQVVGYLDDKEQKLLSECDILGGTSDIGKNKECYYFPAIGNCEVRAKMMSRQAKWYTAIHPQSVIADGVEIGEGTCVMANVVINPGTKVGKGVIVNTAATVDHDCKIENYVHIAPGVHISGNVKVEENSWIGVGSIVINNTNICSNCMIGAGAVVVNNIIESGVYIGVPAKKKDKK